MRYRVEIEQADITVIHKPMDDFKSHSIVEARQVGNVAAPPAVNTRERFWVIQFMCLLTTQNKSGAGSSVDKFLSTCILDAVVFASFERQASTYQMGKAISGRFESWGKQRVMIV